jgi:O-antigen ligase
MTSWLPKAWVVGVGIAAAWFASPTAAFVPLLWLSLLLGCLAVAPERRYFCDPHWLVITLALLAVSWLVALDHELAFRHSMLAVAVLLVFGVARWAALDDAWLMVLGVGLTLPVAVAVHQQFGGLAHAQMLVPSLPAAWQDAAAYRLATGRAFGTASLPGHFAILLLLPLPIFAERLIEARRAARAAWGAGVAVLLIGVVLTRSVAAVAIASLALLALAARRSRRSVVVATVVVAVALVGVTAASRQDLTHLEPVRLRWLNWQAATNAFVQQPWLGTGLGGVGQATLSGPLAAVSPTPYAHNTPLQLLAEFGLAGLGVLLLLVGWLTRLVGRGWRESPGLALAVAVVGVHNLVDFSAYAPEVVLPWAVLAGALAARVGRQATHRVPSWLLTPVLVAGVGLAVLDWRAESVEADLAAAPSDRAVGLGLDVVSLAPWRFSALEMATARVLDAHRPPDAGRLEEAVAGHGWVRPRSASWAESRARLLLAIGRPGEAEVWAREAVRRAPGREELRGLETMCTAAR